MTISRRFCATSATGWNAARSKGPKSPRPQKRTTNRNLLKPRHRAGRTRSRRRRTGTGRSRRSAGGDRGSRTATSRYGSRGRSCQRTGDKARSDGSKRQSRRHCTGRSCTAEAAPAEAAPAEKAPAEAAPAEEAPEEAPEEPAFLEIWRPGRSDRHVRRSYHGRQRGDGAKARNKNVGDGARKDGQRKPGGKHHKKPSFKKSAAPGNQRNEKRSRSKPDPDSPFAALAALKKDLEKQKD